MQKPFWSWDETEFIEVLEVLPEHDETAEADLFIVEQETTRLEVSVLRYEPHVSLHVYANGDETPHLLLEFWFESANRREDPRAEYLEFSGARMRLQDEPAFTVRVFVKPKIRIEFGSL